MYQCRQILSLKILKITTWAKNIFPIPLQPFLMCLKSNTWCFCKVSNDISVSISIVADKTELTP